MNGGQSMHQDVFLLRFFFGLAGKPFLAASRTNRPLKVNSLLPGIVDEINLRLHFAHSFCI